MPEVRQLVDYCSSLMVLHEHYRGLGSSMPRALQLELARVEQELIDVLEKEKKE